MKIRQGRHGKKLVSLNWLLSAFWDWRTMLFKETDGCDPGARHNPGEYFMRKVQLAESNPLPKGFMDQVLVIFH